MRMKSSWIGYYFVRFFACMFALMAVLFIQAYIWPESAFMDSNGEQITMWHVVLGGVSAGAFLWFNFNRMAFISCTDKWVTVTRRGKSIKLSWANVSSVTKIPFCSPPMYRLKFKSGPAPAYFIMSFFTGAYVDTPFAIFGWDFTGFLKYANKRIDLARGRSDTK